MSLISKKRKILEIAATAVKQFLTLNLTNEMP